MLKHQRHASDDDNIFDYSWVQGTRALCIQKKHDRPRSASKVRRYPALWALRLTFSAIPLSVNSQSQNNSELSKPHSARIRRFRDWYSCLMLAPRLPCSHDQSTIFNLITPSLERHTPMRCCRRARSSHTPAVVDDLCEVKPAGPTKES